MIYNITNFETIIIKVYSYKTFSYAQYRYFKENNNYINAGEKITVVQLERKIHDLASMHTTQFEIINDVLIIYFQ